MEGNIFYFSWEPELMALIQGFATELQTVVMTAVTILGEETVMIAIMAYLYLCVNKKMGSRMSAGLIFTLLAGTFLKNACLRRRPYFDNPGVQCLRAPSGRGDIMDIAVQGYSFPSLHAANSAVMFGTLFSRFRKRWARALCILLILLIGYSRVFLGVHYPTDVISGWLLGFLALAAASFILKRCSNWLWIFIACATLSLPGWFLCRSNDFFCIYGLMSGTFLAFHFESRKVHFSNIPNSWRSIIRVICAMAVFMGASKGLKIPFSGEFLESGTFAAHLAYTLRYALSAFLSLGIYPMLFKYTDRFFAKR